MIPTTQCGIIKNRRGGEATINRLQGDLGSDRSSCDCPSNTETGMCHHFFETFVTETEHPFKSREWALHRMIPTKVECWVSDLWTDSRERQGEENQNTGGKLACLYSPIKFIQHSHLYFDTPTPAGCDSNPTHITSESTRIQIAGRLTTVRTLIQSTIKKRIYIGSKCDAGGICETALT